MLAKFKVFLLCGAIALVAVGCKTWFQTRKGAIIDKKAEIEKQLDALSDALSMQWKDVNIQDPGYRRRMLWLGQLDGGTLCATSDGGVLFLVDAALGRVRAAYDAGPMSPITPPVARGAYLDAGYIYVVHDNSIHAVANPDGKGSLRAAWVKKHDGIIVTPICETEHMVFFGDRNQRVYALVKNEKPENIAILMIDWLDDRIAIAPVAFKRADRPFFLDAAGDLYNFAGKFDTALAPLPLALGPIDVPMLADEAGQTLLVAGANYRLNAIDANSPGRFKWTAELGARPVGEMYVYNRAVYVITERAQLMAFQLDATPDGFAGKPLWGDNKVLDVNRVIAQGDGNILYVLRTGNRLAKLDTATGKIVWERKLPDVDFIAVNRFGPAIYLGIKEGYIWSILPR